MKILVATEKPFAAQAVNEMKKVIADSGNEMILLEKGTKDDLIKAVADADGLIMGQHFHALDGAVLEDSRHMDQALMAAAGGDVFAILQSGGGGFLRGGRRFRGGGRFRRCFRRSGSLCGSGGLSLRRGCAGGHAQQKAQQKAQDLLAHFVLLH